MTRAVLLAHAAALGIACREPAPAAEGPTTNGTSAPTAVTEPATHATPPQAAVPSHALPACTRDALPLNLRSLTQRDVEARFGAPATRERFRAQDRQGEFYSGIEDVYPSTDPKNWDVPLEEWTWRSGDCTLTVWFHQQGDSWRVIDDVYWHRSIDF